MTTLNQVSVFTEDTELSSEIIEVLSEHKIEFIDCTNHQCLVDSISAETSIVILDFESGLFETDDFCHHLRLHYPNVKLVLLTLVENLVYCYQLLGGNIFEIVLKNHLTKSKIARIMSTLSYYNQFSSDMKK